MKHIALFSLIFLLLLAGSAFAGSSYGTPSYYGPGSIVKNAVVFSVLDPGTPAAASSKPAHAAPITQTEDRIILAISAVVIFGLLGLIYWH